MYCQSCGTEVTKELNYCNRCGANLNASANLPAQPARPVSLTAPTIAVSVMVIMGLVVIFASVSDMARKEVHPAALTWIVLGGLAMIAGVAALLMRQWTILAGVTKPERPERTPPRKKPLEDSAPVQLPPMRSEPIQSVTDHTTRTFDPVYRGPADRGK
jgi:hypothetical protein